jgi:hypothetical protein
LPKVKVCLRQIIHIISKRQLDLLVIYQILNLHAAITKYFS